MATEFDGDPRTTERIRSGVPINAAVLVSQSRFEADGAAYAVLARADVFADALAGAPLSSEGPLLLSPSEALPSNVGNEIERVLPEGATVYMLGGESALSPTVASDLTSRGYTVMRLAGRDRVATAIAVATEVRRQNPSGTRVVVARAYGTSSTSSDGWADSVTGGAWAAATGTPVVVTPTEELHPDVAAWFDRYPPAQTIVMGGSAALSDAVLESLPNPMRVAGASRAGTAAAASKMLWKVTDSTSPRRFVVVDGYRADGWTYGLVAAGRSADDGAPMLIVSQAGVPEETRPLVRSCDQAVVDLLLAGDENVIPDAVRAELDGYDGVDCVALPPATASPLTFRDPADDNVYRERAGDRPNVDVLGGVISTGPEDLRVEVDVAASPFGAGTSADVSFQVYFSDGRTDYARLTWAVFDDGSTRLYYNTGPALSGRCGLSDVRLVEASPRGAGFTWWLPRRCFGDGIASVGADVAIVDKSGFDTYDVAPDGGGQYGPVRW